MAKQRGKADGKGARPTIVIRREEVVEGGHHGGAWKVAYADFVTAMMAFFLLMWLLNATTEEQRRGLADYFSPANVFSHTSSGYGAPFGGRTPNDSGALVSDRGAVEVLDRETRPVPESEDADDERPREAGPPAARPEAARPQAPAEPGEGLAATGERARADAGERERRAFEAAAASLREAVAGDPALADLARQLAIDVTPEGLRIQIMDEDRRPMFPTGSAALNERARLLLARVAPVLIRLPEPISIAGHTDAAPFRGGERTNWELSSERAHATRRLLAEAGLPEARIRAVAGHADRDPLLPADPMAAANRRIAITVLRSAPAARQEN